MGSLFDREKPSAPREASEWELSERQSSTYLPAAVRICLRKKGVVVTECSLLAVEGTASGAKVLAFGSEALGYRDRAQTRVFSPFKQGKICDFMASLQFFKQLLQKAGVHTRFIKPKMMLCIPPGCTEVDKRAFMDLLYMAGAKEAGITECPFEETIDSAGITDRYPVVIDIRVEDREALCRERLTEARDLAVLSGLDEERIGRIASEVFR